MKLACSCIDLESTLASADAKLASEPARQPPISVIVDCSLSRGFLHCLLTLWTLRPALNAFPNPANIRSDGRLGSSMNDGFPCASSPPNTIARMKFNAIRINRSGALCYATAISMLVEKPSELKKFSVANSRVGFFSLIESRLSIDFFEAT